MSVANRRRAPQQARSKDSVNRILSAARELIGAQGNDSVSMRDIAAHAGISMSVVYAYFEDRNAIIRTLMVDYLRRITERLFEIMEGVKAPRDVPVAADAMVDSFVSFFRSERELGTIWAAVQASTALRTLDVRDGHRLAKRLAEGFAAVSPRADRDGILSLTLFVVDTIVATARIATYASTKDGPIIIAELKRLMHLRFPTLIPELSAPPVRSRKGRRQGRAPSR